MILNSIRKKITKLQIRDIRYMVCLVTDFLATKVWVTLVFSVLGSLGSLAEVRSADQLKAVVGQTLAKLFRIRGQRRLV